jgi:hypothetical protein
VLCFVHIIAQIRPASSKFVQGSQRNTVRIRRAAACIEVRSGATACGTFVKCRPWWVTAAYASNADSGELVEDGFMSLRP